MTSAPAGQGLVTSAWPVPAGTRLLEVLGDLAVPAQDVDAILRLRPGWDARPDLRRRQEQAAAEIVDGLGALGPPLRPAPLTGTQDPYERYFWPLVFASVHDAVRDWHRHRGIADDVGRRSLADLGCQMTHSRVRRGYGGLLDGAWSTRYFQGRIVQLGRLQFELTHLDEDLGAATRAAGLPQGPGDPAIAVHIPAYSGPFGPAQCEEAFARAAVFFPQHFPEHEAQLLTCDSWLLDAELPNQLPASSNIVAFQRLFTLAHPATEPDDGRFFAEAFGTEELAEVESLPQTTSLQRALVAHVRDGGHWYGGIGWRPLTGAADR